MSRTSLPLRIGLSLVLTFALLPMSGGAAPSPRREAEQPARAKGNLERRFETLMAKAKQSKSAAREFGRSRGMDTDGSTVLVIVRSGTDASGAAEDAVHAAGGRIRGRLRDRLFADVPIASLRKLADSNAVGSVTQPPRLVPAVTSEGVADINASALHAAGIDGSGVRVGIIDVGFAGYEAKLGGELPSQSQVTTWGGGPTLEGAGTQSHGVAVAEIVHDVAPGAHLYLAHAATEFDIADAAEWMVAQDVDVINMSALMPGYGPGDGTGFMNEIVDRAVSRGAFWVNAVGNYRNTHWSGDFAPSQVATLNDFGAPSGNKLSFYAHVGDSITGILTWKDSWEAATQDYELLLYYRPNPQAEWGEATRTSEYRQSSFVGDQPYEEIVSVEATNGYYAWSIQSYEATETNVDFHLFDLSQIYNHSLPSAVATSSFGIPADNRSEGFVAVGAVGSGPAYAQPPYSSWGPTLGSNARITPELVARTGVANSVYPYFGGTSSSSPHVAGAAALVLQQLPDLTPHDVEDYLESRAQDLGMAGPDNAYGSGRVWLPQEVFSPLPASPVTGTLDATSSIDYYLQLKKDDDLRVAVTLSGEATVTATLHEMDETTLTPNPGAPGTWTIPRDGVYNIRFSRHPEDTRTSGFSAEWSRVKAMNPSLSASPANSAYGGSLSLTATLRDSDGLPAYPDQVKFYRSYDRKNWTPLQTVPTSPDGRAVLSFLPTRLTYIRAHALPQAGKYKSSTAPDIAVNRKAYLTTPSSATRVARNSAFSAVGYLKPRHTAGSAAVALKCWRYEGTAWVLRKIVWVKVSNYNATTSKYAGTLSLPYTGKWRVSAFVPGDTLHASTYSGVRYVYVQPTTLSITASRSTVTWGISSRLTGVLKDVRGRAIAGKYVYLESSTDGSTWTRVATLRTSTYGAVSKSVLPRVATYYRFRFLGDSTQMPSTSAAKRIGIR